MKSFHALSITKEIPLLRDLRIIPVEFGRINMRLRVSRNLNQLELMNDRVCLNLIIYRGHLL
jgi:hypothetical protein